MATKDDSRVLRIGVVGTARIADKLCWCILKSENATVTAIASRSAERARQWADEHQIANSFGSYADLIESDCVDAVYIALPCAMHAEWALAAAVRGLHVLCEKPFAATAAEAKRVADACEAEGVVLMDGQMWPHNFRTQEMLAAATRVGPIRRMHACLAFAADDDFLESNIRSDPALEPLGCLGDLGWYCVSVIEAFFSWRQPLRVFAHVEWSGGAAGSGVPVAAAGTLMYEDGASASFHCGFDATRRDYLEAHGKAGLVRCDDWVHPHELDTFGTSMRELCDKPPAQIGASFKSRGAGETEWVEHTADACWQEVRMVENFARAALGAPKVPVRGMVDGATQNFENCASALGSAAFGRRTVLVQAIMEAVLLAGRQGHGVVEVIPV